MMKQKNIVPTPYATPEEKYKELKRLTREQLKKCHPDADGANESKARKWTRQLDVIERAWKTYKRRSDG